MELSNYELVRYPSGQFVLLRLGLDAEGTPASGPRDVVAAFASEAEARRALERHASQSPKRTEPPARPRPAG
jgi:hypothetical protein